MTRGLVTVHFADVTPLIHAIERAALRLRDAPEDQRGRIAREEFASIYEAQVRYSRDFIRALPRRPEPQEFHTPKPTVLQ